jgi:hypothetical protein
LVEQRQHFAHLPIWNAARFATSVGLRKVRAMRQLGMRVGPGLLVLALIMLLLAGGPRLRLAFEDPGDPRPSQFEMNAEIAGLGLALVISWSKRAILR